MSIMSYDSKLFSIKFTIYSWLSSTKSTKAIDLAPTILHLFNVPIPVDMDGKVLLEIFQENSIFKKNKIIYSKSQNEKYRIKKKILKLKENHKI